MTTTSNPTEKTKEYRRNYYKKYYKKNIERYNEYNKNRPKRSKPIKNIFYGVEIDGVTYCFPNRTSIQIKKVQKDNLEKPDFKLVSV